MKDDELTESQQIYIDQHYPWVLKIKTFWRFKWWARLVLDNREENRFIVIPPDVAQARNMNDIVHAMEEDLKEIKANTNGLPGILAGFRKAREKISRHAQGIAKALED